MALAMPYVQGPPPADIDALPAVGRAAQNTFANGMLASQEIRHAGTTLHTRSYGYTPDRRVNQIVDSLIGTWTYGYDQAGRLTSAALVGGQSFNFDYTYDTKGNRLSQLVNGQGTTYAFNTGGPTGDRLLSSTGPTGTTTYTYDGAGRPLTETEPGNQITTYTWDVFGRLATVALPTGVLASYQYTSGGERVAKHVTQGGVTTHTYFFRDDHLFHEVDGAGNILATTGFAADGHTPVWRKIGSAHYTYHTDHLGTPILVTDLSGAVVWSAVYEPFGKAQVTTGTISQPWRFPGQYYDEETGLHYNRQRYYDSSTGRYVSPDPVGQAGGLNIFGYATGAPTATIDPLGLTAYFCTSPIFPSLGQLSPNHHSLGSNSLGNGKLTLAGKQASNWFVLYASTEFSNDSVSESRCKSLDTGRKGADQVMEMCVNARISAALSNPASPSTYALTHANCQHWVSDALCSCAKATGDTLLISLHCPVPATFNP